MRLAKLYKNKNGWYVEYAVEHPKSGVLKIKRIYLNSVPRAERKKYAQKIIKQLNQKLLTGWTPFDDNIDKPKKIIKDLIDDYMKSKKTYLRKQTFKLYQNYLNHFIEFLKNKYLIDADVNDIKINDAYEFLKKLENKVGIYFYNRALAFYKSMWKYFVKLEFAQKNIFDPFSKKITPEKQREIIDDYYFIFNYLKENDYFLYLIASLIFYCFVRPKEISFLKIKDFDLQNNILTISANISKNKKTQFVTIPDKLKNELLEYFKGFPNNFYAFGKNAQPSEIKIDPRQYAKRWARHRKKLGLDPNIKLYSFKDTGIVQMLRAGVSPDIVRDQARHYSLEVTNQYIKVAFASANKEILNKVKY